MPRNGLKRLDFAIELALTSEVVTLNGRTQTLANSQFSCYALLNLNQGVREDWDRNSLPVHCPAEATHSSVGVRCTVCCFVDVCLFDWKDEMGQFDDTMKQLMGESPQALVSFLLAGAKYLGDLDRELKTRTIKADLLCRVRWNGELIVLHVEFQRYHDSGMPRRVWKYNALTSIITGKPVCSVVLYLVKDQSITRPFYRARFRNGRTIHWFFFRQIKLWELPPDVFEQPQLAGLLPLLPLTKDGQNRDTVDRMIRKMLEAGKEDILWLAEAFAGLVLTSADDKRWIKGRFHTMLDILKRSWVYQETIEEGEGIGLGKAILQFVEFRFPTLLSLAKQVIKQKMSAEQLEVMLKTLYRANTVEEARTLLLTEE